jgi:glycosyltransferase involved in cell wall biosynthesis
MPTRRVQNLLYFGIYSKGAAFPRSNNQIQALRRLGVEVLEAHVELDGSFQKRSRVTRSLPAALGFAVKLVVSYAALSWKFFKTPAVDAVIVGHPGYFHIHLARLLRSLTRRRLLLVYDAFIPLYEALVEDRGMIRPSSLFSRMLHAFEASCLRNADICLVDTETHRRYLTHEFGLRPEKTKVVRVGSTIPPIYAEPALLKTDKQFRIIFAGTFIPLQGVEVIIEAAQLLQEHVEISFQVVGSGQLEQPMRDLAARWDLKRVNFTGWLPTGQMGDLLRSHHLALGIFGTTPKASRVIPSKVFDICTAGAAFVSADTPAMREAFTHLKNAYLIPPGDPHALAEAILRLKADPDLRARLAAAVWHTGRSRFAIKQIGEDLLKAISGVPDVRHPDRV